MQCTDRLLGKRRQAPHITPSIFLRIIDAKGVIPNYLLMTYIDHLNMIVCESTDTTFRSTRLLRPTKLIFMGDAWFVKEDRGVFKNHEEGAVRVG